MHLDVQSEWNQDLIRPMSRYFGGGGTGPFHASTPTPPEISEGKSSSAKKDPQKRLQIFQHFKVIWGQSWHLCQGLPSHQPPLPEWLIVSVVFQGNHFHHRAAVGHKPSQLLSTVLGLFILWGWNFKQAVSTVPPTHTPNSHKINLALRIPEGWNKWEEDGWNGCFVPLFFFINAS